MIKEAVIMHDEVALVLEHITSIRLEKETFNNKTIWHVLIYTTHLAPAARFHFDSEVTATRFRDMLIEKINDWYGREEPRPAPPLPSKDTFTITPHGIIKQPLK